MDSARSQLADKLKGANNVLVTVSRNPSVDQLAACIGLTLLLNKFGKHAAAVFSGQVPSTLEFLKPEETLEKNTDSLRDFIIALDKSKADKLRYKVEDNVVRIFITPYRTSISQDDLEFSQGDFNVDVVVALGVTQQEDLDEAITMHGRILHDATVATVNTANVADLGSINWQDAEASSLSELVTELAQALKGEGDILDSQIATALLTGIVAETNRFSNEKTTSQTMSASAALMAAGANQQLVATQLDVSGGQSDDNASGHGVKLPEDTPPQSNDGTLEINHDNQDQLPAEPGISDVHTNSGPDAPVLELPVPEDDETELSAGEHLSEGPKLMTEAPLLGGMLTANTQPEGMEPSVDPLTPSPTEPQSQLLEHTSFMPKLEDEPPAPPAPSFTPPPSSWTPPAAPEPATEPASPTPPADETPAPSTENPAPDLENHDNQTLSELESAVDSPHAQAATEMADTARDEVSRALSSTPITTPEPIQALNAQPLGDNLHAESDAAQTPIEQPAPVGPMLADILAESPNENPTNPGEAAAPQVNDPTAPPPVPPPIPFQFGNPGNTPPQQQ